MNKKNNSIEHKFSKRERESGEYGKNVVINFYYFRHGQKMYAKVGRDTISDSLLSEKGITDSTELGSEMKQEGIDLVNIGTTSIDRQWTKGVGKNRTQQTAERVLSGNEAIDRKVRRYFNLGFYTEPYKGSDYFFSEYKRITDEKRDEVLQEVYSGKKLEDLSPDEQEKVMYIAEEPAIEWYLQHQGESLEKTDEAKKWYAEQGLKPNKTTITPRESAALAAYQVNRLLNLPQFMKNDVVKNYFTVGNQLASEPFLTYVVLGKYAGAEHGGKTEDGLEFNAVERLREIGGSLKITEGWHLKIITNDKGKLIANLKFRDKEYDLDLDKIRELAEVGRELYEKEAKKIDTKHIAVVENND